MSVGVSQYPAEHPLPLSSSASVVIPLTEFVFVNLDDITGAAEFPHRVTNGVIYEHLPTERVPMQDGSRRQRHVLCNVAIAWTFQPQ